jgi:acyl carrier protein
MEIKEFIQHFAEQLDETDVNALSPDTVFHELDEYSSIIALSIIAMIDEEYGVAVNAKEMTSSVTIEDLFNVVKSKM